MGLVISLSSWRSCSFYDIFNKIDYKLSPYSALKPKKEQLRFVQVMSMNLVLTLFCREGLLELINIVKYENDGFRFAGFQQPD